MTEMNQAGAASVNEPRAGSVPIPAHAAPTGPAAAQMPCSHAPVRCGGACPLRQPVPVGAPTDAYAAALQDAA